MAEENNVEEKAEEPVASTEAEKPVEAPPTDTTKQETKKSGGSGAIIIIIIVVVLAVLGVGGYFGYKYFVKKATSKTGTATVSKTPSPSATVTSGKVSIKSVIDLLMYPGSTITDQKQEKDAVFKANLTLASADSVDTIKAYYQKLASDKKWQITRQGSNDEYNYYMTVTDGVFTAEIDTTKYTGYDTTDIQIDISGDELSSDAISVSATSVAGGKTATTARTASNNSSGSYIISDSKTRVISESELTSLTNWQLKVARNEIYARYGRPFVHKDLQCYFAKMSWYKEDSSAANPTLNSTESKNVATIQAYEEKVGSDLASSDSGCETNS